MNKKPFLIIVCIVAYLFVFFLTPKTAYADEISASENTSSDLTKAYEFLYEQVEKLLNGIDLSGLEQEFSNFEIFEQKGSAKDIILNLINGDYKIDYGKFFQNLLNLFFSDLSGLWASFAVIVSVAILGSIINSLKSGTNIGSVGEVWHFVSMTVIIAMVSVMFSSVYISTKKSIEGLGRQCDAFLPLLLTLMVAGGGSVSASVYKPQVAFFTKVLWQIVNNLLLPIILLIYLFNAVGFLSDKFNLERTKSFLKSTFKWITGLSVVVFNFFVTAQGLTSSAFDGVSIKALKYALGNSVPLVGNLVSGGFDVVFASILLIKNAVGSFALILILITVLMPVLKIGAFSLFLRFASAIIEPISDKKLSGFLSGVADGAGYVSTVCIVGASSYFITILLIICSLGGGV